MTTAVALNSAVVVSTLGLKFFIESRTLIESLVLLADSPPESGFFDDYSRLQPTGDQWESYIYTKDNFHERVAATQAIVIEQPELFLAPDSK